MNNFDQTDVIDAHKFSNYHRHILRDSPFCGCFYCLDIFDYKNIQDWCDDANTALCPSCSIDAIISLKSDDLITQEFLKAMQKYWF